MKKRIATAFLFAFALTIAAPVFAEAVPQEKEKKENCEKKCNKEKKAECKEKKAECDKK